MSNYIAIQSPVDAMDGFKGLTALSEENTERLSLE